MPQDREFGSKDIEDSAASYQVVPPRRSLSEPVRKLDGWAEAHIPKVQAARVAFTKRDVAAGRDGKSMHP